MISQPVIWYAPVVWAPARTAPGTLHTAPRVGRRTAHLRGVCRTAHLRGVCRTAEDFVTLSKRAQSFLEFLHGA